MQTNYRSKKLKIVTLVRVERRKVCVFERERVREKYRFKKKVQLKLLEDAYVLTTRQKFATCSL